MRDDYQDWTLTGLCRRQAVRHSEREFLSFEDGTRLTFAGLDAESDRIARILATFGIGPGDRVLALLKNRAEFMVAMLATQKLGAIHATINTELKGAFLEHQLRNCEPKLILCETALARAFAGIPAEAPPHDTVVFVAGGVPEDPPPVLAATRCLAYEDFLALPESGEDVLVTPGPSDIACIMYTSGTTGPAKGVLMPHAHCYLLGLGSKEALSLTPDDVYYVCMPLFHANGLFMQVLGAHIAGARAHVIERFSPRRWLDDILEVGATVTNGLGVMPEFVFRQPPRPEDRRHALRYVAAVPVGAEWGEGFESRFGVKIIQLYGMTECGIPLYGRPEDELIPGCAGHLLDEFYEMDIFDPETDAALGDDTVGEIVIRPKLPGAFMAGYYKMAEKTVEAWRNLWFHTGDAAFRDSSGRYHFVDRIKDCIRRRGENISSFEVEQVLNNHDLVAESAVVGIRTAESGGEEEVKACLVAVDGGEIDSVALLDYCVERMPRHAVPRFLDLVEALPKTATGKIQKQELRLAGVTDTTWDRESVGYVVRRE